MIYLLEYILIILVFVALLSFLFKYKFCISIQKDASVQKKFIL